MGKNSVGATQKRKARPPVRPNDVHSHFLLFFRVLGSSMIFLSASIARSGIVNSAMTSMDATVRNLAYNGI